MYRNRILVLIGVLLTAVLLTAVPQSRALAEEETPAEVAAESSITFEGVTYEGGEATFRYQVQGGTNPTVDSVEFKLLCLLIESSPMAVVEAGTYDPDTMVNTPNGGNPSVTAVGVKFQDPFGVDEVRNFYLIFNRYFVEDDMPVDIKAGRGSAAVVNSRGPSQTCEVDESLPVTVSYVFSERVGEFVELLWQTATETGHAGFNIIVDGEIVNEELIPSTVIDSVEPASYKYRIPGDVDVDEFFIQEVSIEGTSEDPLGPFKVGEEYGAYTPTDGEFGEKKVVVFLPIVVR